MDIILKIFDIFLHVDVYLLDIARSMGVWIYLLLFLIIFCETGLVITPLLPGDSLLFAVGALASYPSSPIEIKLIIILLIIAGILGDGVNYHIGKYVGPKIFNKETGFWLNKNHLNKAHGFYEKYGGKTIIIARFIPIIRTFAPFVAGIGTMHYFQFLAYNIIGAVLWVLIFCLGGFYFAEIPFVKNNFQIVIIAIIIISIIPAFIEYLKARCEHNNKR